MYAINIFDCGLQGAGHHALTMVFTTAMPHMMLRFKYGRTTTFQSCLQPHNSGVLDTGESTPCFKCQMLAQDSISDG